MFHGALAWVCLTPACLCSQPQGFTAGRALQGMLNNHHVPLSSQIWCQ